MSNIDSKSQYTKKLDGAEEFEDNSCHIVWRHRIC